MAKSKCIKCGSSKFEMVRNDNLEFVQLVQCAECGGVIGVVECINEKENNLTGKLEDIEKQTKETLEAVQRVFDALYRFGIR